MASQRPPMKGMGTRPSAVLAACALLGALPAAGGTSGPASHAASQRRACCGPLRIRGGRGLFGGFDLSTRYYELLGLRKGDMPGDAEIKKAYHKMALKCHPDRAPPGQKQQAEAEFKALKEAYDVLSDANKRHVYDTQGEAGIKAWHQEAGDGDGGHDDEESDGRFGGPFWARSPHDMPSAWERYVGGMPFAFGEIPAGARHPYTVQRSVTRPVYLSLEELYHGGTKQVTTRVFHIDERSGFAVPVDKTFSIPVKPGWKEGTRVTFDDEAGLQDVVFIVRQQKHACFRRAGDDLMFTCLLTPREVREGANVSIPTISDGAITLRIQPKSKMVTEHKRKVLANEGMPLRHPSQAAPGVTRGSLIIRFVVRGWLHRTVLSPTLAVSRQALKVGGVGGTAYLVLRRPIRSITLLWTLASRLALLAGLLVMYT